MHELLGRLLTEVVPPDDDHVTVPAGRVDVRCPRTDRHDEDLGIAEELVGEPERRSGDRRRSRLARSAGVEDDLDRRDHSGADPITQESQSAGRLDVLRDGHDGPRRELEPDDRHGRGDENGNRADQHDQWAAHDHTREP